VGTASSASVRRRRARRLLEWSGAPGRSLVFRIGPWDATLLPAARYAAGLDLERRGSEVATLLEELCAIGRHPVVPATPAANEKDACPPAGTPERSVEDARRRASARPSPPGDATTL